MTLDFLFAIVAKLYLEKAGTLMCGLLPDNTDRRTLKNGNHQICMSGSVKADDMDTCYINHNNSIQGRFLNEENDRTASS